MDVSSPWASMLANTSPDNITGLIIAIVLMILFSAFFSATETAFSSLNKIRLKNLVNQGSKRAKKTLDITENYDKLLTTILIGNNLVNIVSTSLATLLFTSLIASEDVAVTVSTAVMTVVVLIFGEISPKSIAKEMPEKFAMAVTPIITVIMWILMPFNWLFTQWKKLLVLIFKPKNTTSMSEEELITIVDEATTEGGLDKEEGELIRSAIEFNDLTIREIFTPRVDVFALPITATKEEFRETFVESGFSRLPIYDGDIDNIIGVVHEKDFYRVYFDEDFDIKKIMGEVICVTLANYVSQVLKQLQKSKMHMAVVVDEYGGTAGIVTMEDMIEEIVGEIWDEHDEVSEDIQLKAGSEDVYIVKGASSIEDFFEFFNVRFEEDELDVNTVSGWLIEQFGKLPEIGESVTYKGFEFTIIDSDNRRIESAEVKRIINAEEDKTEDAE